MEVSELVVLAILQEIMDYREMVEKQAIDLIKNGEYELAIELLKEI